MKKMIIFAAAICTLAMAGCTGIEKTDLPESSQEAGEASDAGENMSCDGNTDEQGEQPAAGEEKIPEYTKAANKEESKPSDDTASTQEDGAVIGDDLESSVIQAAQELYETACMTEWDFTVGSPYELDLEEWTENDYGWQFFKVSDDRINSLDDVLNDYRTVFSSRREDHISDLFIEQDGNVYCLNGARGSDIFYEGSVITSITGQSDGEIDFIVEVSYSDDGMGSGPYTTNDEFTIVKENDEWKVEKFRLPY